MIEVIESAAADVLAAFADVIDVRTPAEFADDHVPGAVNLPVLSNDERARVGTIYVQESPHRARKIGAALVARNIAGHIEGPLAEMAPGFSPLIYCWRGGQRSNAMAGVLSQVGWRVRILKGGYKTYRRRVMTALYESEAAQPVVLLDGATGTAKTDILARLAGLGVQTLDLERLASHRGSLFGAVPGLAQPSQKLFETRLLAALEALDPGRPVIVEAESSKIGERVIPPRLWKAMVAAPTITLRASLADRAGYLVATYSDILHDRATIQAIIDRLPRHLSGEQRKHWRGLAHVGAFEVLAAALIEAHYDPAYERSACRAGRTSLGAIELTSLASPDRQSAAEAVARIVLAF
ncbi:MAG: tRNA 2-selenouridine(34) synthase MnmH [Caulobacteraceae bacterium]